MDIGLMVEGQNGLTWERWCHILALTERLGFPSLFRSDHYFVGRQRASLEAYLAFAIAARETSRVRFGPLVSPVTFRAPVDVGRMAAQIDILSGGRFVLGLGAGWNEAEHRAYGIPFPSVSERFDRLEEAIAVIRALWAPGSSSFRGRFYQLRDAECLPKPPAGRPPILIGGTGERRTLRLAAQYASEWNCDGFLGLETYARKKAVLERHCEAVGRDPDTIRRSMLVHGLIGPNQEAIDRATRCAMNLLPGDRFTTLESYRQEAQARRMMVGTTQEVVDNLGRLAELGVQEVQFEHFDLDSDEVPAYLASDIAPRVAAL